MKKTVLMIMMSAISLAGLAQENETTSIEQVIHAFAKAGDNNDAKSLDALLEKNYRIVMNQLFGSNELSVVDRATYLTKIADKEWGGDNRKVTIHSIKINGTTAVAQVELVGEKSTFVSFYTLIKNAAGEWKFVSDTPTVKPA